MYFPKPRLRIGTKLFLSFTLIFFMSMLSMRFLASHLLSEFGRFSNRANEESIKKNTYAFLEKLTHEKAHRYETIFQKAATFSALLAGQAEHRMNIAPGATNTSGLRLHEPTGMYTNGPDALTMVHYWGSAHLSVYTRQCLAALSPIDPLLDSIQKKNPEIAACYIVTKPGIRRYAPNLHCIDRMPPADEYDITNRSFHALAGPAMNPERKTIWTNIYRNDMGQGLVITASTPIYESRVDFAGVACVDISLDKIRSDIFTQADAHAHSQHMVPFLLDDIGVIIAMKNKHKNVLGLDTPSAEENIDGVRMVNSLLDSSNLQVRSTARAILGRRFQVSSLVLDKIPYIISSHAMPSTGWRCCLVIPESVVFESIHESQSKLSSTMQAMGHRFTAATCLFLLVSCMLIALLVKNFVKPVKLLSRAATRVKEGDLDTAVDIHRNDETGVLASSFNGMVAGLKKAKKIEHEYTQQLEHKVYERTKELETALHKLRASEQRLSLYIRQTPLGVIEWGLDFTVTEWNPGAEKIFAYSRSEALGKNGIELILESDRPFVSKKWHELVHKKQFTYSNNRNLTKDGSIIECEWFNTPLTDEAGSVISIISLCQDITDRKRLEQERIQLSSVVEQTDEAIFIMASDGTVEYINPAAEKVFGYTADEAVGLNPFKPQYPVHERESYADMWNRIKDGSVWKEQITNRKKDGTSCELQVTISPVRNEETGAVTNYVAVCRNITNELKLQRELRQAQKMEAIGTLAGGIAHDFNNILGVILGYTEISFDHAAAGTPLHENLTEVMTAGERAKNLVRQILAFSRQTEQGVKPISITSIIKETVKFIRSTFPSVIEIRQQFKAANDVIMADPTQIHQIIMNLCTNAKHAIGEQAGVLEVRVENCEIDSEAFRSQGLTPGTYVKLGVSDTGCGMEKAMLEKIFDPFFTTKEPGKGTGLGLSVVHGIVKSYGGTVHAYSEPGNGASFSIYFPVINTHQETAPETGHSQITGGTENILVVDDEENIVKIMQKMLEHLGYSVTPRTSSVEALEVFRNRPHSFDLIITDQTMPNMTGVELAQEMKRIRQDIPIILCTGFSEMVTENKARDMCIQAFLMKPVLLKDIAETIKSVLTGNIKLTAALMQPEF